MLGSTAPSAPRRAVSEGLSANPFITCDKQGTRSLERLPTEERAQIEQRRREAFDIPRGAA
eukprot:7301464-Prymnesium_polylepis.2